MEGTQRLKCLLSYCDKEPQEKSNYCTKHQKLPIRSQVCAPKGKRLIQLDLSQAEAWIVAYLASEEKMKKALQFGDIHCLTAAMQGFSTFPWEYHLTNKDKSGVTEDKRYLFKRINHGGNYQMKEHKQTEVINKDSDKPPFITVTVKQVKIYREKWLAFYNLRNWWLELAEKLKRDHCLITPYRRKRVFYGPFSHEMEKEGTAYIPQSTVADHCFGKVQKELGIKGGLYEIVKQICEPSNGEIKLINSSHDSGILECPIQNATEIAMRAKKLLERPLIVNGEEFTIPVDVEMGERWGELEKLKVA